MRLCGELGLVSPLTKAYMGQIDGLNDCLVLENINKTGYVKCALSPPQKVRVKRTIFSMSVRLTAVISQVVPT